MDDRFLQEHRREPERGFANALRGRLRRLEGDEDVAPARIRLAPALATAAVVVMVAGLFLVPSMRAAAQSVLDLFRVRNFAAVPFDASRMDRLRELAGEKNGQSADPVRLGVEKVEVLKDSGPARVYPTLEAGAAAAGLTRVRTTGWLPTGMAADSVRVQDETASRLTLSTARLRSVLDALDLRDVQVPALDGKQITVRMRPALIQTYRSPKRHVMLAQSEGPEVTLPEGVDLAQLGEIGLRVLGLEAGEARRIAHSVDLRTTMLVPVPANAASFRQVTVQGRPGLLILSSGNAPNGQPRREGSLLLWTEGDRVLALGGDVREMDLMQMAESLR
jgi:hypothetical protein